MNWNDIQYFICLVDKQTLSAAGEKLNVQHTTVARRIQNLENTLNIKLFDRIGKRYHLTTEGDILYTQACEIEKNIHTFTRISITRNLMQGNVTVSAPPILANELVMPNISRLVQKYPDICLSLKGEVHHSNLYQREADIALRIGRPTQDNLVIRKLTNINYTFYSSHYYLKKIEERKEPIKLIEFHGNQKIWHWSNQIKEKNNLPVAFVSNDLYMIKNSIIQGVGIGILPVFLAQNFDNLVTINPNTMKLTTLNNNQSIDPVSKTFELYLVMHSDVRHSPKVRAVADWIISIFNKNSK